MPPVTTNSTSWPFSSFNCISRTQRVNRSWIKMSSICNYTIWVSFCYSTSQVVTCYYSTWRLLVSARLTDSITQGPRHCQNIIDCHAHESFYINPVLAHNTNKWEINSPRAFRHICKLFPNAYIWQCPWYSINIQMYARYRLQSISASQKYEFE